MTIIVVVIVINIDIVIIIIIILIINIVIIIAVIIPFKPRMYVFCNSVILILPFLRIFRDDFAPGPCFKIFDWTCYHLSPWCQIFILSKDILQGSSRLCS